MESNVEPSTDKTMKPTKYRHARSRQIIAIVSILAMILELFWAQGDVSGTTASQASAIQIIQLWTPHIYHLMLIIGITIAAYIWTRATD